MTDNTRDPGQGPDPANPFSREGAAPDEQGASGNEPTGAGASAVTPESGGQGGQGGGPYSQPPAPPSDPYGSQPGSQPNDPYGSQPGGYGQPYPSSQPSANPYGQQGQPGGDPYSQPSANPYGQQNPYPTSQPSANPYGQQGGDPYGQPGASPYGQPQPSSNDPYGQQSANPYGQPSANAPYEQPGGGYDPQAVPGYGSGTGYDQSGGYGVNPYQSGYPAYGAAPQQHPSAVVALVTGILGLVICPPVGIAGIVLGRKVRNEIDADPSRYSGRGMGTAGFILGIVAVALMVLYVIIFAVSFAASSS